MPQGSMSYSGLDEIDTGLQAQRSTLIQSQNRYMERPGEPRNRTPPAARTVQQTGFSDPIGQAREPTTKGQHSYAINNSPQNKSSTYDPNKLCTFHDRKGHSTEECRAALRSQNKNKKTSEDTEEEEEKPATPKSHRKTKGSSNKRSWETEPESPSSPPPAPKKRVDMISWGSESHTPNRIEGNTEGRVCIDITAAIRTLENLNEATPPPSITRYNPNAGSPFRKIPNFKRKQKMVRIRELLERPIAPQIQKKDSMRTLNRNLLLGSKTVTTKLPPENPRRSSILEDSNQTNQARPLRNYHAYTLSGRCVATKSEPKLGRYEATELESKLGRYVATERSSSSVATTPEISSARSGRYMGENSQRPPQQNMPQRSMSYSGLDEIDTRLQAQRSTPIQSQNIYMERPGEPWNRTPPAARTVQQTGFSDPIGKARGHSTEECRAALRSQNENKKTSEDTKEEEDEPATPKSHRKTKGSSNKRSWETEPESPSSPPPAPKKRVDMISWGPESHTPNIIEGQTERRVCIDITVAIRTLENLNEATPPPSITRYNPNAGSPFRKIPNFKRKKKMTRQLEQPRRKESLQSEPRTRSGRQSTIDPHHQIVLRFRKGPRSPIEPEPESGIAPEKDMPLTT
ncbi:hypothetical protein F2Q70_00026434 [Brassica cretica]|uniref:Uncharacterized protein n=1 Tax=Brassica cretica TaxID=69181 RepID=A0A8S9LAP4_BRACR|nr:hypothetical protein F2Q70_00026434 [Brassica cretica]